jgi:NRAMP (natural resistance-associated macrophage protein)-like metal ion transporter
MSVFPNLLALRCCCCWLRARAERILSASIHHQTTMTESLRRQSFDSISNGSDPAPERTKSSRAAWLANVDEEELISIENLAAHQAEVDVPTPNSKQLRCCCCDLYTLWKFSGPGWLMSIAYLDPGNLEADLQSGAYTGYQLLWMLFWATIAGLLLQILAARLGVVTGKNLAQMCRLEYSRPVSNLLWVMTETAIIGSDIQEVLGSAIALKLLFGLDLWIGCLITGLDTFTFLIIHAYGVRKLEAFFAALIFTMMVCFFVNFGFTGPQWMGGPWNVDGGGILLGTLVPTVNDYAVIQAVGILGAVIMPHNIYLHSALVQSRNINRKNPQAVEEACKYNAIESAVALIVSFFINAAVVTVFARGFFAEGQCAEPGWNQDTWSGDGARLVYGENANLGCYTGADAKTAQFGACHRLGPANATNATLTWMTCTNSLGNEGVCCSIGLQNAGQALEGLLGSTGRIVWAIGLLAAGQGTSY